MLAPEQQVLLDELYWHTNQTVTSLCAQFGLTSTQLGRLVTPLPAGFNCWWCQQSVSYRKRSERDNARRSYRSLTCSCGAEQPENVDHPGLVDTDAAIVAPLFETRERYGSYRNPQRSEKVGPMSEVVRHGVKALADVGLRWAGVFVVLEAFDSLDGVISRLHDLPTRTLVVPSLTDLMRNEGDSLALFFRLVASGWRVISAAPAHFSHSEYDGWCDDLVDRWTPSTLPGSRSSLLRLV